MTARWVPSGNNLMWATWVGDAQVIYVIAHEAATADTHKFWVHKKVSGASEEEIIGRCKTPERAREIAELDSQLPL
jgi:hypothetical protein